MRINLKINGMHCNSCATAIEFTLKSEVKNIKVDYSKKIANIDFDDRKLKPEEIIRKIGNLGYKVTKT